MIKQNLKNKSCNDANGAYNIPLKYITETQQEAKLMLKLLRQRYLIVYVGFVSEYRFVVNILTLFGMRIFA